MLDETRRSRRFPPGEGSIAWIDPRVHDDERNFKPTIPALVTDESLRGCGIVVLSGDDMCQGAEGMIRVGDLPPLRFQVSWVKNFGATAQMVGLMFLE